NSLWKDRLHLHPVSLQEFAKYNQLQYDVILSNPPFFISSLKSPDAARNTARHTGELLFEDILTFAQQHLTAQGKLYLLLPPPEAAVFQRMAAEHRLYLSETLQVFNQTSGKCIRHIQTYTSTPAEEPAEKVLHICEADAKTYTADFAALLKEYYLIF
ncbi:MAG: methyltransferase, partial [Hymenobacteraceae bacterium]|nr:methyltransferase [Hymenobacteraceae bacterium]